jgi:uncharacterized protein with HEPN domain
MPTDDRTKSYLWDMREAIREIKGFMRGVKFHQFEKNKMLRSAVERQLLILGEAANHISPQFRKKHPEVDWKRLVELRNVIAHEYGEMLINRIWTAATEVIPAILEPLNELLTE